MNYWMSLSRRTNLILGTLLFIIIVRFVIKPIMQIENMQNYGEFNNNACIGKCNDDPYKAYRPMMVDVPVIPGTVNNPVCAWHAKSKCGNRFPHSGNSCFLEKYTQCASTNRFN